VTVPFTAGAFGFVLMRQFMFSVLDHLIDAACIDGAGEWRIFWRVVLPLLKPALAALAVFHPPHPGPRYADTTGEPGVERFYAPGPVTGRVDLHGDGGRLNRVWQMIGCERLSQLYTPGVGEEFAEALALARDELGATRVRAHAIFHDDLGVHRLGEHDFSMVDAVYDRVLELGLRPVVELSFMPRELAADPEATVFEYGASCGALRHRRGRPLGVRGLERGEPRGLLDRPRARSTSVSTTSPPRRSRPSTCACSWTGRRPRRRAGSRTSSTTWWRSARRWISSRRVRSPTGS
jgi:hypothetical protein